MVGNDMESLSVASLSLNSGTWTHDLNGRSNSQDDDEENAGVCC